MVITMFPLSNSGSSFFVVAINTFFPFLILFTSAMTTNFSIFATNTTTFHIYSISIKSGHLLSFSVCLCFLCLSCQVISNTNANMNKIIKKVNITPITANIDISIKSDSDNSIVVAKIIILFPFLGWSICGFV